MNYYNDIKDLIGHTPMLKINHLNVKNGVNLFAKLEQLNPGGSIKDRIGISMIKKAEEDGQLVKGSTIIEATAGNTGLGIALAALNTGYKVVFVVPNKFSIEKQTLMKALGAEIVNTSEEKGMRGAIEKSEELLKEIKNSISLKQFENPANPQAHYETTGPEIYNALDGKIDYFVAGAGSGGTFAGIVKYLKERNPSVKAVLADPIGSIIGGGNINKEYRIEGIGNDFIPETMDVNLIDDVIKISDKEAYDMVRESAKKEGLIVGSSSGAALFASIKLSKSVKEGSNIVTLLPDRGDRYFSENIY